MPVSIVMAAIIGVMFIAWIIKRSRAEAQPEFRQDTMRYITIDPDRKQQNQVSPSETSPTMPPEGPAESECVVSSPRPIFTHASQDESQNDVLNAENPSPPPFATPDLLVSDER